MSDKRFGGVSEQAKAVVQRLEDARALIREERWRGAMYLGGYVVECQLKKKLMEKFSCSNLIRLEDVLRKPRMLTEQNTIFSHQLEPLLRLCGGLESLRRDRIRWSEFVLVNEWAPAWRYSAVPATKSNAQFFLEAVNNVRNWIENNV